MSTNTKKIVDKRLKSLDIFGELIIIIIESFEYYLVKLLYSCSKGKF